MSKKMGKSRGKYRISEKYMLEGNQFDWTLISLVPGKDKNGNPKISERKHYFPRLTQIATHIVQEDAKEAQSLEEFIATINKSTADITAALMGVEERLAQSGNTNTLCEDTNDGAGPEEGQEEEGEQPKTEKPKTRSSGTGTRRRRRKKA